MLLVAALLLGAATAVIVDTQYGPVQGFTRDDVNIWLGIPYAAPPGKRPLVFAIALCGRLVRVCGVLTWRTLFTPNRISLIRHVQWGIFASRCPSRTTPGLSRGIARSTPPSAPSSTS